jgi:hypothetical protein
MLGRPPDTNSSAVFSIDSSGARGQLEVATAIKFPLIATQ